eukprot:gene2997-3455_t
MPSLSAKTKVLLKARLMRLKLWSEEKATAGVAEYEKFLCLKAVLKDFKATKLSPSLPIDEVWHLHILDTERYSQDCIEFCGEMIHHDVDGDIDIFKRAIRRNATKIAYQMQNGSEPSGEMWHFEEINDRDAADLSHVAECNEPTGTYIVFCKVHNGEIISLNLTPQMTIQDVKAMIGRKKDIDQDQLRLIFVNKQLEDDRTVSDYNIKNESTIHVVLRLKGC